ncbi:MAG: hypothetical protein KY452_04940, partial [Actinobacteria bacterium]|nr:hypothetical protein [Actinomycetota bacterium]
DSPDGPVLATFPDPQPSSMTSRFTLDVPIPEDISTGEHLLVATQEHHDHNGGIPARAAIYVNAAEASLPTTEERPTSVVASSGPGVASLVLIGLGATAVALLLAAAASAVAARGSSPAPAEGGEA